MSSVKDSKTTNYTFLLSKERKKRIHPQIPFSCIEYTCLLSGTDTGVWRETEIRRVEMCLSVAVAGGVDHVVFQVHPGVLPQTRHASLNVKPVREALLEGRRRLQSPPSGSSSPQPKNNSLCHCRSTSKTHHMLV